MLSEDQQGGQYSFEDFDQISEDILSLKRGMFDLREREEDALISTVDQKLKEPLKQFFGEFKRKLTDFSQRFDVIRRRTESAQGKYQENVVKMQTNLAGVQRNLKGALRDLEVANKNIAELKAQKQSDSEQINRLVNQTNELKQERKTFKKEISEQIKKIIIDKLFFWLFIIAVPTIFELMWQIIQLPKQQEYNYRWVVTILITILFGGYGFLRVCWVTFLRRCINNEPAIIENGREWEIIKKEIYLFTLQSLVVGLGPYVCQLVQVLMLPESIPEDIRDYTIKSSICAVLYLGAFLIGFAIKAIKQWHQSRKEKTLEIQLIQR